jgi:hypothetical protein
MDFSEMMRGKMWATGSCSCEFWIFVSVLRTTMSDCADCGGCDSGGGGYDGSNHHDSCHDDYSHSEPSHNTNDCHSTAWGWSSDADVGSISRNKRKSKSKDKRNWKTRETEVQPQDCCCTLIWNELCRFVITTYKPLCFSFNKCLDVPHNSTCVTQQRSCLMSCCGQEIEKHINDPLCHQVEHWHMSSDRSYHFLTGPAQ